MVMTVYRDRIDKCVEIGKWLRWPILDSGVLRIWNIVYPEIRHTDSSETSIRLYWTAQGHVPEDHNVDVYLFWCEWDWLLHLYLSSETSETDLYLTASPLKNGVIHCPETSVINYQSLQRYVPERGMPDLRLSDKIQVVRKLCTFWFVCGGCPAGISVR